MIFITFLWKFKDTYSFNLGNYISSFKLAFLFGCAGCLQHFVISVSSEFVMMSKPLAFHSLQRPSYKARPFINFVTCFRFQESARFVAFLKLLFKKKTFLHWCLYSLEEVISLGFTHSCYFSGPLKKGRIMTSRTRVGGNGEKTTQLIRRLLNVLASNLEAFDLQLEALWQGTSFPSWYFD